MKRILLYLLLISLLITTVHAQESYEYLYNPYMAMSRDGQILAVSGRYISDATASLGFRAPVDFYDATTGDLLGSFDESEHPIQDLDLNSDGSLLVYSNANGRIAIVDVQTGSEINVITPLRDTENHRVIWTHNERVVATAFGSTLEVYDILDPLNNLIYFDETIQTIFGIDWSEDNDTIILSASSTGSGILIVLQITENSEFELVKTFDAPAVINIAVDETGTLIASQVQEGIRITDIEDESEILLPHNEENADVYSLDWSDDSEKLVVGGSDLITIWDVQSSEITEAISVEGIVSDVFFSPDGEYIYHTAGSAGIYLNGLPLREAIAAEAN